MWTQIQEALRQSTERMLTAIALRRGYRLGWAAHKFKEKFGDWPAEHRVAPLEPSPEVLSWELHCRIRYAKSMQKAQAANA